MTVDLSGIDSLILADVEITFAEAAKADPTFAEAVAEFTALPLPVEGGEHQ